MRDLTRYNRTHTQYALQFFRVFSYHPVYRFYIFQSGILEAHVRVEAEVTDDPNDEFDESELFD